MLGFARAEVLRKNCEKFKRIDVSPLSLSPSLENSSTRDGFDERAEVSQARAMERRGKRVA